LFIDKNEVIDFSDNSDNWDTESNYVMTVDCSGGVFVRSLFLRIIPVLGRISSLVFVHPVSAKRGANIKVIAKCALHEAL